MAAQPTITVETDTDTARTIGRILSLVTGARIICDGDASSMLTGLLGAIVLVAREQSNTSEVLERVIGGVRDAQRRLAVIAAGGGPS